MLSIKIDGQPLDINEESINVNIDYKLEDLINFQQKKGVSAIDIKVPASPKNDAIVNTFHDPRVQDLTPNKLYENFRKVEVEDDGLELLTGKAILVNATHKERPIDYTFDFYGGNSDWNIDLSDVTFFDLLKHLTVHYTKENIVNSWAFNGRNEALPYVFAPVRYGRLMDSMTIGESTATDYSMDPTYMRPAISKYWLIYWAFKKAGYKIKSTFLDLDYFRRQVMPWTWGGFLESDGTKFDQHKSLAKGEQVSYSLGRGDEYIGLLDLQVTNDSVNPAFDNNNNYSYDTINRAMTWQYKAPHYGPVIVGFNIHTYINIELGGTPNFCVINIEYFINGVKKGSMPLIRVMGASGYTNEETRFDDFEVEMHPDDVLTVVYNAHLSKERIIGGVSFGDKYNLKLAVDEFSAKYFKIPLNGYVGFDDLFCLKNFNFLDFLRGVTDEFNLAFSTDAINKVVTIEPLHDYVIGDNKYSGFISQNTIDWQSKQDLSQVSEFTRQMDSEREMIFKYMDDPNDGILKVVNDRHKTQLGSAKYLLPERFKVGKSETENRFFSPTMHYEVVSWKEITGVAPQMVCMIPENVSNTSKDEAQNTFNPKSCYYKGLISGVGGWVFDKEELTEFPFMFAVNYTQNDALDPVLSYSNENIDGNFRKGLLQTFYLQRMANLELGLIYNTWVKLKNIDIDNKQFRDQIEMRGINWELIEINNYNPTSDRPTSITLRATAVMYQKNIDNIYPSRQSVINETLASGGFDYPYKKLLALTTDINK